MLFLCSLLTLAEKFPNRFEATCQNNSNSCSKLWQGKDLEGNANQKWPTGQSNHHYTLDWDLIGTPRHLFFKSPDRHDLIVYHQTPWRSRWSHFSQKELLSKFHLPQIPWNATSRNGTLKDVGYLERLRGLLEGMMFEWHECIQSTGMQRFCFLMNKFN